MTLKSALLSSILFLSSTAYSQRQASAAQPEAHGAARVLWSIDFTHLDPSLLKDLVSNFPNLKTGRVSPAESDEILSWLVLTKHLDRVSFASSGDNNFILSARQIQSIHQVSVEGMKSFSESDIYRVLEVSNGAPFNKNKILGRGENLRNLYRENGYFNASISIDFKGMQTKDVDVIVKISEGPQTLIDSVKVISTNSALATSLTSIANGHLGDVYTAVNMGLLKKDLRNYLSENQYFRAEIPEATVKGRDNDTKVEISFTVDHPENFILEMSGQEDGITYSMIKDAIGFNDFQSTSPQLAQEIAAKVKTYLYSLGYARAEIKAFEEPGFSTFQKKIRLEITQNKKVSVKKVEFTGRISQPPEFYSKLLLEQSGPAMSAQIFVKEDLDKGLKNMVVQRRNNGFFRAKVISSRTAYNEDHDGVTLYINFDEGPLTVIEDIQLQGVLQVPKEEVLKHLHLKTNEPLKLNELESGLNEIKEYYHNLGFLEMKVANELGGAQDLVTYNQDNTLAHLNLHVSEGPLILVENIVVQGNTLTKEYVVRKELEFKKGDVLTPAKMNETKARLQRLGLFSAIEIHTLEENSNVIHRTVIVTVNDRNPGLVNFGAGATTERRFTLRGFGGLAYRNIGGYGRLASIRADINYLTDISFVEKKLVLSYLEPYLFDSRLKGRLTFTEATFVQDFNALAAVDLFQTNVSLEQEITSHLRAGWDLINFSKYHTYSAISTPSYAETNTDIGATGPNLEIDYRNHPFNPTKGTLTRYSAELGLPELASSDQIRYFRTNASFTSYWNTFGRVVWANNVQGGYLHNMMNNGYVPYDKKGFVLGGATTIRGFANSEAFPNSTDLKSTSYPLTSEAIMYLVKSEISFPISGNFGGAFFYDGGQVILNDLVLPYGYFRDSAGFAVRYNTPVGPISAEVGWKLNEAGARGEGPYAFNLSIGSF